MHEVVAESESLASSYQELDLQYDADQAALWFFMQGHPRPCFTPRLLSELQDLFAQIPRSTKPVEYVVAASGVSGAYNLGGDLDYFCQCIEHGDREALRAYAYACLDLGFTCTRQFNQDIATIALIQGSALGGGFEAALSCNTVVAEESAQIGFPEVVFNLFPGMGAYSYLARRVPMHVAEELIQSGRIYSGRELYERGAVDVLAKDGEGVATAMEVIAEHKAKRRARLAMHKARLRVDPLDPQELRDIADIWVDAALETDARALRTMQRLTRAQSRKHPWSAAGGV